jgi:N6-adenosine-specific RNA methylase IME4
MLFTRLVVHHPGRDNRLHALGRNWALPPRSRFVMADMRRWGAILLQELKDSDSGAAADTATLEPPLDLGLRLPPAGRDDGAARQAGYRVITLDPPWANKSADRGKRYPTTDWDVLPELPLAQLADSKAGCLVAVWVTNKHSYWEWLVNTVFPSWGAEYVTTWYWLKVCDDGAPVLPLDKHRERKPFEPLVIGVIPPSAAASARHYTRWRAALASNLSEKPLENTSIGGLLVDAHDGARGEHADDHL